MKIPKGEIVYSKIYAKFIDFGRLEREIKEKNFSGYILVDLKGQEKYVFYENGEKIFSEIEFEKIREGNISLFRLPKETVNIFSFTRCEEGVRKYLEDTEDVKKYLEELKEIKFRGVLELIFKDFFIFFEFEDGEIKKEIKFNGEIETENVVDKIHGNFEAYLFEKEVLVEKSVFREIAAYFENLKKIISEALFSSQYSLKKQRDIETILMLNEANLKLLDRKTKKNNITKFFNPKSIISHFTSIEVKSMENRFFLIPKKESFEAVEKSKFLQQLGIDIGRNFDRNLLLKRLGFEVLDFENIERRELMRRLGIQEPDKKRLEVLLKNYKLGFLLDEKKENEHPFKLLTTKTQ